MNNYEIYINLISNWIEEKDDFPINCRVPDAMIPLKLALQGSKDESQALLTSIRYEDEEIIYIHEAMLFNMSTTEIKLTNFSDDNFDLAYKILTKYPSAIIANLYMANYYYKKLYWPEVQKHLERVFVQLPNIESQCVKLIYICILAQDSYKARTYLPFVKKRRNKLFCWLGVYGMSSKYQRVSILIVLAIISLFYPYAFYLFFPGLFFFLIWYLIGKKAKDYIVQFVSIEYIKLFIGWSLLSYFIHRVSITF